jgi:hypothetical protein
MSDYNDGKIHGWNGGECPVHPESVVKVWRRNGGYISSTFLARELYWGHDGAKGDIIAFQVTKPYAEPKVIWVNECHRGGGLAYISEEEAKSDAGKAVKRIAVKYVEDKE